MSQFSMDYVFFVLGKYLQMMVAYSIFKEDQERVTVLFESFNGHIAKLNNAFLEVTGEVFKPGREISLPSTKPEARVRPTQRLPPLLRVSSEENRDLYRFQDL